MSEPEKKQKKNKQHYQLSNHELGIIMEIQRAVLWSEEAQSFQLQLRH